MKALVVYSSKTGFVEKYAKWIAEELSTEAVRSDDVSLDELKEYDTLIFGGGLYAGGINGVKFLKKALEKFRGKKIAVFATGASPPGAEVVDEVRDGNFTREEQKKIGFFYLRGGFDYDKLGIKDRLLMKLLKKKLESKKELTEDEEGMLSAYDDPVDFTDRDNIRELVDYVRNGWVKGPCRSSL